MRHLKFILILLWVMLLPGLLPAQDGNEIGEKNFKHFLKENVATRMVSEITTAYSFTDNNFQMVKVVVKPELKIKLHENLRFTGIARFYVEMLDKLEPGRPNQDAVSDFSKRLLVGDRAEIELREFYLDWYLGKKSTLRLGKQQIVWGETDGIKLLDVVNPQNFREFILEEFEDSRIPLWATKAEFPIREVDVEIVWVPDMTYHDIPGTDAPFFPTALMPPLRIDAPVQILEVKKPDRLVTDSDIGIKLSTFSNGWDLTLNYLFHYDDLPVPERKIERTPDNSPLTVIQPVHKRMHTIGGTFNNVLGPITLRGELAYNVNRSFTTGSTGYTNGIVGSDQFMMAVGVDWLFNETMLSGQLFNDLLIKNIPAYNRNRQEINYSLLASQELFNDDLKLEVLMVQNLKEGDGMIRPKASYYLRSNLQLILGSDIFFGRRQGFFGQYNDLSRIFLGLKWGI